ncbi:NUDIX hydrolase (plasmid) [Aliirhizobium terrae]|uniref:NUDIX domain-containing protein n=1 Tax=Terrirhizobium terrae TaxID=2926709 RepID=UPI002579109A|nr:NUDIX hydrolase [Rhizobium sp. CC-CFT758]WJH38322.1 NUDIX hydrolase [Rhizobium sp. CC-CFT758]
MAEIVCAAFIDNGRVLLVRRAAHRKWSANKWDLVGGHVEKGEGLDVALVRECQEEVGLTPRAFEHVATLYEDGDRKRKSPFHIFRVPLWDGGNAQLLGQEHSELGWFAVDGFHEAELAFDAYSDVVLPLLKTNQ